MALDYNIIGARIKKERLAQGFTQEDLAEKLDISVAFLSRVECGSSHINLKRLSEICSLLKIDESKILTGSSSQSSSYLKNDFNAILSKCSPSKQKLIYKIAKIISEEE